MTVEAVTFDCWGTLIWDSDYGVASAARVAAIVTAADGELDDAAATGLLDRAWRRHHDEWLAGRQFGSVGIARFCADEIGLDEAGRDRLQAGIEEAGRMGSISTLEGAATSLKSLRAAGLRTALVCDAGMTPGRIVRDYLRDEGIIESLEFLAFSDEVGVPKPSPEIFTRALEAIDTPPERAVHVGDLLRTDIHGGRQMGMKTIRITETNDDAVDSWARRPDEHFEDADAVIASHAELPGALQRLGADL